MDEHAGDQKPLRPRWLLALLLLVDAAFVTAYYVAFAAGLQSSKLFKLVDLDLESNPPTWWSSSQLLLAGVLLLALAVRPLADQPRIRPLRGVLALFGVVFVFLSLDEEVMIHEHITGVLSGLPFVPTLNGHGVWMFVYGAVGLIVLAVIGRPLLLGFRLWPRHALLLTAGLATMILGGVVIESISYYLPMVSVLQIGAEELLETVGESIVLFATVSMVLQVTVRALFGKERDLVEESRQDIYA